MNKTLKCHINFKTPEPSKLCITGNLSHGIIWNTLLCSLKKKKEKPQISVTYYWNDVNMGFHLGTLQTEISLC